MNRYQQLMKALGVPSANSFVHELPGQLSEDQLAEIERKIGCALPTGFRDFFGDFHGVQLPVGATFPLRNPDSGARSGAIQYFFGIAPGQNLIDVYRDWIECDWPLSSYSGLELVRTSDPVFDNQVANGGRDVKSPKSLLPIGSINSNNRVMLMIDGLKKGQVYYWLDSSTREWAGVYLVADSFDQFMNLLRPATM